MSYLATCQHCEQGKRNQVSFRSESREPMTDKTEKGGEQRVCEVCHERKTIQPSSPYCAVCLAKHAKKPKEPKREALEAEKKTPIRTLDDSEKSSPGGDLKVAIDFKGYADILQGVKQLAHDDLRPLAYQIIYMLKTVLPRTERDCTDNIQKGGSGDSSHST